MGEPSLFERRPILSAPLRWRVELAALCLLLGVFQPWLPLELDFAFAVLVISAVMMVLFYTHGEGADLSLLQPKKPRLEFLIGIVCLVGFLVTLAVRAVTNEFLLGVGHSYFLFGALVARPLGWFRKSQTSKSSFPH